MKVQSLRKTPRLKERAIEYFQAKWANKNTMMVYEDCISHSLTTKNPLPHWYLLMEDEEIIGCAGLITNDFISRMDLYPWICAIYIEEKHRGKGYGSLLMEQAKIDAKVSGFSHLYLCTDHVGYYEKYGFEYIATGYHPWGDTSRIYSIKLDR